MGYFSPDSSITGGLQTNLTSPTYTLSADTADALSKSWAVTGLGGTQTGVRTHTAGDPFSVLIRRERYKARPSINAVTGQYPNVPLNRTEQVITKGLKIDSAGTIRPGRVRIIWELPAGSESNDSINIEAMASLAVGLNNEESADLGQTLIAGLFG
jgi:hypothetical protein